MAQNFQGQALPLGRAQVSPEMDKAGGPAPSRNDCHAHRLAEEPLPLFRALPSRSSPRGRALKVGGGVPRSSSLGVGEAGGTSAPSLPRAEASAAKGQGWGCTGVRSVLGSLPGRLPP